MNLKHTVKVQKYVEENGEFHKDTFDTYEISYIQKSIRTFDVLVDGYNTGVHISIQPKFPYRKKVAEAINAYRKVVQTFQYNILAIAKFEDRDELTQLKLYQPEK